MSALKGTEFKMDTEQDPFKQEIYLFRWLEAHLPKSNKKMVQILKRIYPLCPTYMQLNFFKSALITHSNDPLRYVTRSIAYSYEFPRVVEQLIAEGNHGMIFDGDAVHGVVLKAMAKWLKVKDGKWTEEQEEEIAHELMRKYLVSKRRKTWVGRIVLFAEFGFSGLTLATEWVIPDDDWAKLQKVWAKEDNQRTNEELQELMALVGDK